MLIGFSGADGVGYVWEAEGEVGAAVREVDGSGVGAGWLSWTRVRVTTYRYRD